MTSKASTAATDNATQSAAGGFGYPAVEQPDFQLMDGPGMDRRDTFVGTPLYVSPEMLHETKSLPASDLWALGCIIYRMHVGTVPFEDKSETGTFDKILNR